MIETDRVARVAMALVAMLGLAVMLQPVPAGAVASGGESTRAESMDKDYAAGIRAFDAQDWQGVVDNMNKVVARRPWHDNAYAYLGLAHRKLGETARGMAYYQAALTANPDNLLARSYLGQAYAEAGDMVLARTELSEIRARGGRGTWAETALRLTLETGRGTAY